MSEFSCAKCGACSVVCPVYRESGRESHAARGKLHLIDVLGLAKSSAEFVDIFSACLLCGACSVVCPRNIEITKELVAARNSFSAVSGPHGYEKYLARKLLDYPGSLTGLRVLGKTGEKLIGAYLPDKSGLRLRLALFQDNSPPLAHKKTQTLSVESQNTNTINWFPGCAARYLFPETLTSCHSLMAGFGIDPFIPKSLACCGLADWAAGDIKTAREKGRQNIKAFEKLKGEILVSCASCFAHLKDYPRMFEGETEWQTRAEQFVSRLVELSVFLDKQEDPRVVSQEEKSEKMRVFYHAPCHLRNDTQIEDKAREQLQKTGRAAVLLLEEGDRCCGQGGLFHLAHPEISAAIRDQLVQDVLALQPDLVTSTCSGCLMQWQQGLTTAGSGVRVLHLAQVLEELKTDR